MQFVHGYLTVGTVRAGCYDLRLHSPLINAVTRKPPRLYPHRDRSAIASAAPALVAMTPPQSISTSV